MAKDNKNQPDNFDDLMFAAPEEAVTIGESFLFRSGPVEAAGGDGKPGSMKNTEGETVLHCGWFPVQGILAERKWVEKKAFGKDGFWQYLILLTKPALGIGNTDEGVSKHFRLKPGQFMLITESGALRELDQFANHPRCTAEVYLRPTGKTRKVPNGTMKLWECKRVRLLERQEANLSQLGEEDLPPELQGDIRAPALPAKS